MVFRDMRIYNRAINYFTTEMNHGNSCMAYDLTCRIVLC